MKQRGSRRRIWTFIGTWLVLLLAVQALAGRLPANPKFDQPVKLEIFSPEAQKQKEQLALPLDVVLESLAKSVGLQPFIYHVYGTLNEAGKQHHEPDWPLVRVDFAGKPFREVWNLLFATYGVKYQIDYLFLPPDTILVAPVNQLRTFKALGKQTGETQLEHYKIEVPINVYLKVQSTQEGAQTVDIDLGKAKEWFKNEYLPHIIGEVGPVTANWLVVQDNETKTFQVPTGTGSASVSINPAVVLFSLYATPAQHKNLTQYMKMAGIGFSKLAPPPPQKALIKRFYQVRFLDPEKIKGFLVQEIPGIAVNIVPGQKLLVVSASEAQHAQVAELLKKADVPPEVGPPVFQRTFQLSNAKAKDLAKVLKEALEAKGVAATQGQAQPAEGAAPKVSIVADERTNTLIVTGTAEQIQMVEKLIPTLDKPVEQVNVQVRIQEVSSSVLRNLGLNWNLAGGNFVAALVDSGLSLIFDSTRTLASLNIGATLNALEKQGLSRKINDSNITMLNNQKGRIQSGFTFFIRRVVEGKVEKVPYDAGVIVEVTPQVTNSGEIVLKIHTEVSDILERNPVDGDVDKLSKQVSDTTLRVKDGQTVVLGGLIKQSATQNKQGIPFLQDIPVLGYLFSKTTYNQENSELLIVLKAERKTPTTCPAPLTPNCSRP